MLDLAFAVAVASEVGLGACVVASLARPEWRVWPPPGRDSWQYRMVWLFTGVAAAGILVVGVLDWNTFVLAHGARLPLGASLAAAGGAFATWGIRTLSWHASLGLEAELVTAGPYRWTRNPQYVGDIALLLGWAIACNSLRTWVLCALGIAWFALAPRTEEPWLRAQYGPAYERYRRRLPRFLGRPAA